MSREPKEGELYRLEGGHGWCRHGLVIIRATAKGELIACDTYWGGFPGSSGMSRDWYTVAEVRERLTFLIDMNTARECYKDEHEVYADEDRAWIPMGGGRERYLVRKDAKPYYPRQVARLDRLIREERSRAETAAWAAARYEKDLQELRDAHVHRPSVQGPCREDCGICSAALVGKVVDAEIPA